MGAQLSCGPLRLRASAPLMPKTSPDKGHHFTSFTLLRKKPRFASDA